MAFEKHIEELEQRRAKALSMGGRINSPSAKRKAC